MLATTTANALASSAMSDEKIALIKRTICKGASNDELVMFIRQCDRTGLDPFLRQIYAVKRWDSQEQREVMSVQISIDGLRLIAERTGLYRGQTPIQWCGTDGKWVDAWLDDAPPSAAKVGIWREGFKEAIVRVAKYSSYCQRKKNGNLTQMWEKMPEVMLGKCAESLALRTAFPLATINLSESDEVRIIDVETDSSSSHRADLMQFTTQHFERLQMNTSSAVSLLQIRYQKNHRSKLSSEELADLAEFLANQPTPGSTEEDADQELE